MGELVRLVLVRLIENGVLFRGQGSETLCTPDAFPTKFISEMLKCVLSDARA